MALLDVLHFPDARLRNKARAVASVDENVLQLATDMLETMYAAPGIGLAAIQVNIPLRVVTIDISKDHNDPLILINPQIIQSRGTFSSEEGCLSVPDIYEPVERAQWVRFSYLDENAQNVQREAEGMLAVCVQHEIDHLDGRLFVDYISTLKRERIRKKLLKLQRSAT